MQFWILCNAAVETAQQLFSVVTTTLLTSLLHETLHRSWLENLISPHHFAPLLQEAETWDSWSFSSGQ